MKNLDYSSTKKSFFGNLRWWHRFIILIVIIISPYSLTLYFPQILGINQVTISSNFVDDPTMKQMVTFMNTSYDTTSKKVLRSNSIRGFSLEKNVFSFRNISSTLNSEGNCLGMSLIEKYAFLKTEDLITSRTTGSGKTLFDINKLIYDNNLGRFKLNQHDKDIIYKKQLPGDDKAYFALENNTIKPFDINAFSDIALDSGLTVFNKHLQNQDIENIVRAINYYQSNADIYSKKVFIPYTYFKGSTDKDDLFNKVFFSHFNFFSSKVKYFANVDVNIITDMIDKNIPAIMGIWNDTSGHALLGYKYEFLDKDTLKVYISDSNFPLFDASESNYLELNKQIRNFHVLFKKFGSRWHYKYNPIIRGNVFYKGIYNSFYPGTEMDIF